MVIFPLPCCSVERTGANDDSCSVDSFWRIPAVCSAARAVSIVIGKVNSNLNARHERAAKLSSNLCWLQPFGVYVLIVCRIALHKRTAEAGEMFNILPYRNFEGDLLRIRLYCKCILIRSDGTSTCCTRGRQTSNELNDLRCVRLCNSNFERTDGRTDRRAC